MKASDAGGGAGWRRSAGCRAAAAMLGLVLASGCAVPVHQQRLLARSTMQFSDSPVQAYQPSILAQTEAGAGASGGAQAAGCTSCR